MGHDDQAPAERAQLVLEPGHGGQVEVVGGLVEDQELGRVGQDPGQRHPLGLAAREGVHLRLGGPGHAQAVEGGLGLPASADRPGHRPRRQDGDLLEEADPRAPPAPNLAGVGEVHPGHDSEQRRLARAVDADHADAVPVGHRQREALEEDPVRPSYGDVLEIDEHGHEGSRVPATPAAGRAGDRDRDRERTGQSGGAGTVMAGASVPPSTWRIFPVTQPEAGEAR